jgi:hypothetical protein
MSVLCPAAVKWMKKPRGLVALRTTSSNPRLALLSAASALLASGAQDDVMHAD